MEDQNIQCPHADQEEWSTHIHKLRSGRVLSWESEQTWKQNEKQLAHRSGSG